MLLRAIHSKIFLNGIPKNSNNHPIDLSFTVFNGFGYITHIIRSTECKQKIKRKRNGYQSIAYNFYFPEIFFETETIIKIGAKTKIGSSK